MAAINGLHVVTEPHLTGAEASVHVMQPVSHGVDGVNDEAHLAVLNVVVLQTFVTCPRMRERQELVSRTEGKPYSGVSALQARCVSSFRNSGLTYRCV